MAVKIIIKRSIGQDVAQIVRPLIIELRAHAMRHPGYISGETLKCIERRDEYVVISTWESLDEWEKWLNSSDRKTLEDEIDLITGKSVEYTAYVQLGN